MPRHALVTILTCSCILAVGAASRGDADSRSEAPKPPESVEAQVAALRAQVKEQAAEIRSLREKVEELQARSRDYRKVLVAPPQAAPNPAGVGAQQVPPGWIPREFNGTTYYVVPLAEHH